MLCGEAKFKKALQSLNAQIVIVTCINYNYNTFSLIPFILSVNNWLASSSSGVTHRPRQVLKSLGSVASKRSWSDFCSLYAQISMVDLHSAWDYPTDLRLVEKTRSDNTKARIFGWLYHLEYRRAEGSISLATTFLWISYIEPTVTDMDKHLVATSESGPTTTPLELTNGWISLSVACIRNCI